MERARWNAALDYDALAVGKVTGTNREVEAVVAASPPVPPPQASGCRFPPAWPSYMMCSEG